MNQLCKKIIDWYLQKLKFIVCFINPNRRKSAIENNHKSGNHSLYVLKCFQWKFKKK